MYEGLLRMDAKKLLEDCKAFGIDSTLLRHVESLKTEEQVKFLVRFIVGGFRHLNKVRPDLHSPIVKLGSLVELFTRSWTGARLNEKSNEPNPNGNRNKKKEIIPPPCPSCKGELGLWKGMGRVLYYSCLACGKAYVCSVDEPDVLTRMEDTNDS